MIAAPATDLEKGHPGAQYHDNALSKARFDSSRLGSQIEGVWGEWRGGLREGVKLVAFDQHENRDLS